MIQVAISARLRKRVDQLPPEVRAAASEAIANVAAAFGHPQQHGGLGLRKLGRYSYEVRAALQLRVVFFLDGDTLTAYDVMDHNEVRRWVRGQVK